MDIVWVALFCGTCGGCLSHVCDRYFSQRRHTKRGTIKQWSDILVRPQDGGLVIIFFKVYWVPEADIEASAREEAGEVTDPGALHFVLGCPYWLCTETVLRARHPKLRFLGLNLGI